MSNVTVIILLAGFFCRCSGKSNQQIIHETNDSLAQVVSNYNITTQSSESQHPHGVTVLMKVYPSQVFGFNKGSLLMINGERIVYDDGVDKDFVSMLDNSDPEDMFKLNYNREFEVPENWMSDAGRSRCEQLFKAMYGHNDEEVRKSLVRVAWFGQQIPFTAINGAADSLRAVAHDIGMHPEYIPYMKQSSSYYWRTVRGSTRQSAHSYGIAIDINTSLSNYWLWSNPNAKELDKLKYENRVPLGIVKIFEKHGFIWGGRWYHFDTMHFEFRPEFLVE